MQYLAICQTCRYAFALPSSMDLASCPKPECRGTAVVSDASFAAVFQALHEAYPMMMSREQRREIKKLLRKMVAGKITAEEALEDKSLSPETINLLTVIATLGVGAVNAILMLLMLLQSQVHHEENRQDQARANEVQREFLEALAENLGQLHQNDEVLAARLSRAGEARLVEIEEEQEPARPRRRVENEASPKPQSPEPPTSRKRKKDKKP